MHLLFLTSALLTLVPVLAYRGATLPIRNHFSDDSLVVSSLGHPDNRRLSIRALDHDSPKLFRRGKGKKDKGKKPSSSRGSTDVSRTSNQGPLPERIQQLNTQIGPSQQRVKSSEKLKAIGPGWDTSPTSKSPEKLPALGPSWPGSPGSPGSRDSSPSRSIRGILDTRPSIPLPKNLPPLGSLPRSSSSPKVPSLGEPHDKDSSRHLMSTHLSDIIPGQPRPKPSPTRSPPDPFGSPPFASSSAGFRFQRPESPGASRNTQGSPPRNVGGITSSLERAHLNPPSGGFPDASFSTPDRPVRLKAQALMNEGSGQQYSPVPLDWSTPGKSTSGGSTYTSPIKPVNPMKLDFTSGSSTGASQMAPVSISHRSPSQSPDRDRTPSPLPKDQKKHETYLKSIKANAERRRLSLLKSTLHNTTS